MTQIIPFAVSPSRRLQRLLAAVLLCGQITGCNAIAPESLTVDIPDAEQPGGNLRDRSVNRIKESPVVYVKLGTDVLRPVRQSLNTPLPDKQVGPYELREETLAAALQLVTAGEDIPLAFQTSEALARTVTVSQLHGTMSDVVERLCSLADLYCAYEKGVMTIKDVESFTVSLPPLTGDNYDQFLNGIKNVTGRDAYIDTTTRTLIYSTSHRNSERADAYFQRLRANTALIVFETQIWEVTLNNGNEAGVKWETLNEAAEDPDNPTPTASIPNTIRNGAFGTTVTSPGANIAGALSGGIRYLSGNLNANIVLQFLSSQGAVKTISQPQITVLSGSTAKLRVGNSQKYVSQVTRTAGVNVSGDTLSLTTDTIDTGLNLEISSAWDNATVYGNLKLDLKDLIILNPITVGGEGGTTIQLPETAERSLETRIRVRPGDALIIGGIVQERDSLTKRGLGGMAPVIPSSRSALARNSELVIMMRPRVVVYTDQPPSDAVLLNDGMYLQNPNSTQPTPAINVMAPPQGPTVPATTPLTLGATGPVVNQATENLTITDANAMPPAPPVPPPGLFATAPTPPPGSPPANLPSLAPPAMIRPKPLTPEEVEALRRRATMRTQPALPPVAPAAAPASVSPVPPAPSMSQYLNDLAPMQIAPPQ